MVGTVTRRKASRETLGITIKSRAAGSSGLVPGRCCMYRV